MVGVQEQHDWSLTGSYACLVAQVASTGCVQVLAPRTGKGQGVGGFGRGGRGEGGGGPKRHMCSKLHIPIA